MNRARAEEDPIDAVITDRITNTDVTDGLMRRNNSPKRTGVNMNSFIETVSAFKRRITQPQQLSEKKGNNGLLEPMLDKKFHSGQGQAQADVFEYAEQSPDFFYDAD